MHKKYFFTEIRDVNELNNLKEEWLKTLTSPQDGMWESFRTNGVNWGIRNEDNLIGYATIGEENQLLQFYLSPRHFISAYAIFEKFRDELKVNSGIVGTNNPGFLSMALNFAKDIIIHTYLFRDSHDVTIQEKEGTLKECNGSDIERVVNFCHASIGAPKEWLNGYIGDLINKREIFSLERNDEIIGTCEVRRSISAPKYADIGMIVSPDYRRTGYGTYLLNKAKTLAVKKGKIPICSCEKGNVGSLKSIQNCGFTSMNQLLSISFK